MAVALYTAIALLAGHIASYGDWIVDDAGITFAYARNLATGHGLLSQPGAAAVEGFTDLLWALLLAPTMWLGWFDAVWLPKVLGWLYGGLALCAVAAAARGARPVRGAAAVAALLTAANPAFAIWCGSGLENGLLAAMVALSLWHASQCCRRAQVSRLDAAAGGILAALTAAVRPDPAVFAAGLPLLLALAGPGRLQPRLAAAASCWRRTGR